MAKPPSSQSLLHIPDREGAGQVLLGREIDAIVNNDTISDATQAKVKDLLKSTEKELESLEANITCLQLTLNDLLLQRATKLAQMGLYRTTSAPSRRVPNEILEQIFSLACHGKIVSVPYKTEVQQWVLSHICSRWRSVSFAMPQLWNRICLDYLHHTRGIRDKGVVGPVASHPAFLGMARELLRKSAGFPLFVSIVGATASTLNPFEPILPDLHRVIDLYVADSPGAIRTFLYLPPGRVPSLHSLRSNVHGDIDFSKASALLSPSSCLRQLSFRIQVLPCSWIYKLPLHQLTHLAIPSTILRPSQIVSILYLAPALVECSFAAGAVPAEHIAPMPDHVDLTQPLEHNLTSLNLNFFAADAEATCLQGLVLPKLREFVFQTGFERLWDPKWAPTILRSGLLHTMILRDISITSGQLERLLEAMPHLIELDVSGGRMLTSAILQKMACGALVPKLSILRCLINFTRFEEYGILDLHLEMLRLRKTDCATSHITDVQFFLLNAGDPKLVFPGLVRLNKMKEEGWNISIMMS